MLFKEEVLPGCSCFANTQEALPECFPQKVSAQPVWRSAGRGEAAWSCVFCFFMWGLSIAEAAQGEGGVHALQWDRLQL